MGADDDGCLMIDPVPTAMAVGRQKDVKWQPQKDLKKKKRCVCATLGNIY